MLHTLHRLVGSHPLPVRLALAVRNQMDAALRCFLVPESIAERNGELELLRAVAPRIRRFADVGANRGEWTDALLKLQPACEGLLFEPSSEASRALAERFARHPTIQAVPKAMSDREGTAEFFEEPGCGETSSLVRGFSNATARRVEVPVNTLDAEVTERRWDRLDFLKIDAEGHDFHVLRGAAGLLKSGTIGVVQFEYNRPWRAAGSSLPEAAKWLSTLGYETRLIRPEGLFSIPWQRLGDFYQYSNLCAFRPECREWLAPILRGAI